MYAYYVTYSSLCVSRYDVCMYSASYHIIGFHDVSIYPKGGQVSKERTTPHSAALHPDRHSDRIHGSPISRS